MMETLGIPLLLYARETYADPDGDHSNQIHWELLDALKRRDKAAAVAGVMRNALKSKAVFARALHHRLEGEAAPSERWAPAPASELDPTKLPEAVRTGSGGRALEAAR